MFRGKKIAVVIPAYNEEKFVQSVVQSLPEYIDKTIAVDDASTDRTLSNLEDLVSKDSNQIVICRHAKNQGVGGAIATGYKKALELGMDIAVVMAGDGQMHPDDLPDLLEPIISGQADYTKGNRLYYINSWHVIPKHRFLGNSILSFLTKFVSGYWHIFDSQTGYTAISKKALQMIDLDNIYKRYGMPIDILVKLNISNLRVKDVPVRPIYSREQKSKMKIWKVVFTIPWMMTRLFLKRILIKYAIRDFHPIFMFYLLGFLGFFSGLILGFTILIIDILSHYSIGYGWMILGSLCVLSGLQFVLTALLLDYNLNN